MAFSSIKLAYDSRIATITFNRPDKRNALSRDLIDALSGAFARALKEDGVRCVILAAAGPVFCAGMDVFSPRFHHPYLKTNTLWANGRMAFV